ncbi:MAG: flagellin [Dongiaceae bacterium]
MVNRISNSAQFQRTQFNTQILQNKIAELQIQAATGEQGRIFSEIASNSSRFITLENSHTRLTRYQENIASADRRLDQMDASLGRLHDTATRFRALLTSALNANNADNISLTTEANQLLNQVAAELNTQFEGKYLFSGNRITTAPVSLAAFGNPVAMPENIAGTLPFTAPTYPGTPPTVFPVALTPTNTATYQYFAYYQGDVSRGVVRADDNLEITTGTTADSEAFVKLIYSLRLAATYTAAPADEQHDRLEEAYRIVTESLDKLADLRSQVGSEGRLLQDIKAKHVETAGRLEGLISDIQAVDVPKTIAELSAQQTQLQASYLTISRLSEISLVQFLR